MSIRKLSLKPTLSIAAAVLGLTPSLASAQVPPPPPPPAGGELVVMMVDMSGSMNGLTPDGDVKFDVAMERAHEFLDEVRFGREYELWLFSGVSATPVITFEQHATAEQVRAELNWLATPADVTPFSGTFCDAVDHLMDTQFAREINAPPGAAQIYEKRIALYTDGFENSTPESHECWGHRSMAVAPETEVNSWQWKIFNKANTGNAMSPPGAHIPATVITDVTMIFDDFIPSAITPVFMASTASQLQSRIAVPQLQRRVAAPGLIRVVPEAPAVLQSTPGLVRDLGGLRQVGRLGTVVSSIGQLSEDELALRAYAGVTLRTGGEFLGLMNLDEVPLTGDTDGNQCVDLADYNAVMENYGNNVGYNHPADLNRDRTVNYSDYLTLLNNWNDGC